VNQSFSLVHTGYGHSGKPCAYVDTVLRPFCLSGWLYGQQDRDGIVGKALNQRNAPIWLTINNTHTCVLYTAMPTRTLSITDEAYQALKASKKEGESFTDVILRLTENKGSARRLLEMMGEMHSPELAGSIEQASKEFRKNFRTRDVEL